MTTEIERAKRDLDRLEWRQFDLQDKLDILYHQGREHTWAAEEIRELLGDVEDEIESLRRFLATAEEVLENEINATGEVE